MFKPSFKLLISADQWQENNLMYVGILTTLKMFKSRSDIKRQYKFFGNLMAQFS